MWQQIKEIEGEMRTVWEATVEEAEIFVVHGYIIFGVDIDASATPEPGQKIGTAFNLPIYVEEGKL